MTSMCISLVPISHTILCWYWPEMKLATLHDFLFLSNLQCILYALCSSALVSFRAPHTTFCSSMGTCSNCNLGRDLGMRHIISPYLVARLGLKPRNIYTILHYPLLCFRRHCPVRQIRRSVDAFQHCKNELAQGLRDTLTTRKRQVSQLLCYTVRTCIKLTYTHVDSVETVLYQVGVN